MSYCWVYKRKDRGGVYYIGFAERIGRKPYSLNTRDRALAQEAKRRIESELWCGERGIKRKTVERIRYSDLLLRFSEHKRAAGVNPKTLSNYEKTLNQFGTFMASDLFVDAISPEHLERFISYRRQSPAQHGEGLLAPKSLRNEVFTLINLFSWAVSRDLLLESPMRKVTKPKKEASNSRRALTYEEYPKLKAAIKNEAFSDLVDFFLLTGIRRSDGLRITSENFDLVQMVATLPQHKQRNVKRIPISPDLAAVVQRIIGRVGEGKPFVQISPGRLTENFCTARTKAGLPSSVTFHSLRHSFASWLAALGTDFRTLQALTGHSSSEALGIYLHAFDPAKRSAIEKLHIPRAVANG